MKYRTLFSSLLCLVACLPLAAQPVIPKGIKLTDDERTFFQSVMDRLGEIGLKGIAERMEKDLANGRLTLMDEEAGARGSTTWHFMGQNTTEMPKSAVSQWRIYQETARGLRARGHEDMARQYDLSAQIQVLDVALTFDHEYVHMDQQLSAEGFRKENAAWRHRLDQEKRLIRELTDKITTKLTVGIKDGTDRLELAKLRDALQGIGRLHRATVDNEVRAQINGDKITRLLFEEDLNTIDQVQADIVSLARRADDVLMAAAPALSEAITGSTCQMETRQNVVDLLFPQP